MPLSAVVSADIAAIRSHLVSGLGPPHEVLELSGSPDKRLSKLEIASWTPGGATGPLILVSCGISKLTLPDGRRVEALIIARPQPSKEELAVILKLIGKFGLLLAGGGVIGPGTVIRAPEELRPVSSMTNLVVLPALTFPPPFRQARRPDGSAVDLAWLAPMHDLEAKLVEEQGGEALVLQLTAYSVDLASWRREPIPRVLPHDEAKAMIVAKSAPPPEPPKSKEERVAQLKAAALDRAARAGQPQPPAPPGPPPAAAPAAPAQPAAPAAPRFKPPPAITRAPAVSKPITAVKPVAAKAGPAPKPGAPAKPAPVKPPPKKG